MSAIHSRYFALHRKEALKNRVPRGLQRSHAMPTFIGVMQVKCWWARLDSNQGPTDYEFDVGRFG